MRLLHLGAVQRFGIQTPAGPLVAAAKVQSPYRQSRHHIALWPRPQVYGLYEQDLSYSTLNSLGWRPGLQVEIKVDATHRNARAHLAQCGLHTASVLLTLRWAFP